MGELKRGRGRPKKEEARRKQLHFRVTENFYNELKELSEMEGESCVDYIIESVRIRGALTRVNNSTDDYEDHEFDEN